MRTWFNTSVNSLLRPQPLLGSLITRMTKLIFSDVQKYGYLLIICKKEHVKYKMAKSSFHLCENNSHVQISQVWIILKTVWSIHKDRKIWQKPFPAKNVIERNNIFAITGKKMPPISYCACKQATHSVSKPTRNYNVISHQCSGSNPLLKNLFLE